MLEHVTARQTRFVAPGLSADARGVALGRSCVVLLPSVDRVVGLFRGLSERGSLDDLLGALKILQVRTPLKSREFVVQIPVSGSHVADGIAAAATLMGGLTFTGSAKHFVKYRDAQSPLGYDVDTLHPAQGDFILYASEFVQAYQTEREIPFARLALGLSLEHDRRSEPLPDETVLLRVVPGLWRMVTAYLYRNKLSCQVAACERVATDGQPPERLYLIRCQLAPRMEPLFRTTPGIEVHQLKTERVAIELGYRHPLELGSCASVFERGRFYLFSGRRRCLDILQGDPAFFDAGTLVEIGLTSPVERQLQPTSVAKLSIPLRLVSAMGPRPPVRASCIPASQAEWLKKLVYLLPPQVLGRYSFCGTADNLFLVSDVDVEFVPLGTLYYQAAAGVLVPIGYELVPRIHPELLVQHLGTGQEKLIFFRADGPPVELPRSAFASLSRQALARVEAQRPAPWTADPQAPATPRLVNDPLGLFPLWGFSAPGEGNKE